MAISAREPVSFPVCPQRMNIPSKHDMYPTKSRAAAIAASAIRILQEGEYTNLLDETISIRDDLQKAVARTESYPPDAELPPILGGNHRTTFEVVNETTLAVAERLASKGERVVALNFASAKHPGGGFLGGARAQEESLCRSSGLYACINGDEMYAFHAQKGGGFYTNYAIYSPDVPVFFTDAGNPLPNYYRCSFITSPAVNAGTFLQQNSGSGTAVRTEMIARIDKVLTIAAGHGHEAIVLGAWGCGVFRNDPNQIAELFADALRGQFQGVFRHVVFAVLDYSEKQEIIGPFAKLFG
jgi:uncharacterized protein (TIGR02452 family)